MLLITGLAFLYLDWSLIERVPIAQQIPSPATEWECYHSGNLKERFAKEALLFQRVATGCANVNRSGCHP
jgi:hypothetical protein